MSIAKQVRRRAYAPGIAPATHTSRRLAAVVAVAVTAAAAGCGGGTKNDSPPTPTPTATRIAEPASIPPRPLNHCDSAGSGWRTLPTPGAVAAHMGRGGVGVVFVNDSVDDACEWAAEARALARRGYAVAVFLNAGGDESRQAVGVGAALRANGARRIVLIGASVGARAVLQAGARHPRGVVGLVALSAERRVTSSPSDLLPVARRVQVPVLSIGSRGDPLTTWGKDTIAWDRTLSRDRLLLLRGDGHGADLLAGRNGPRVRAEIIRFLHSVGS
jgi:pimeloyl-ACP methyl ester carboxylesterase